MWLRSNFSCLPVRQCGGHRSPVHLFSRRRCRRRRLLLRPISNALFMSFARDRLRNCSLQRTDGRIALLLLLRRRRRQASSFSILSSTSPKKSIILACLLRPLFPPSPVSCPSSLHVRTVPIPPENDSAGRRTESVSFEPPPPPLPPPLFSVIVRMDLSSALHRLDKNEGERKNEGREEEKEEGGAPYERDVIFYWTSHRWGEPPRVSLAEWAIFCATAAGNGE